VLKSLKQFGYPYVVFFLVVGLLMGYKELISTPTVSEKVTVLSATVSADDEPEVMPEELVSAYQEDITSIVSELESILDQKKTDPDNLAITKEISGIEQELLNKKVPEIYRNLHLDIFSITQSVKQFTAKQSDQPDGSDIQAKILTIKNQYAWF
jgi:hypothetical protein